MSEINKILVTGGLGFIGSEGVRQLIDDGYEVINLDAETYAACHANLESVQSNPRYHFEKVDICDQVTLNRIFTHYQPDAVMHLAAESHVDRSIENPAQFAETNSTGTVRLLTAATSYWSTLLDDGKKAFRFHHISTDEVYGSLSETDPAFTEATAYTPNSPYAASKAASDHFVRAWFETYGLPILITNCGNNYGPYQFPEKLIPITILRALAGEPIQIYGEGKNIRDWIHVSDHVAGLKSVLLKGTPGETYNIGANGEQRNIDLARSICGILDELRPASRPYADLITFVKDRPGHDHRYAINADKIKSELRWMPQHSFETGLRETIKWYLEHENWWRALLAKNPATKRIGEVLKTEAAA